MGSQTSSAAPARTAMPAGPQAASATAAASARAGSGGGGSSSWRRGTAHRMPASASTPARGGQPLPAAVRAPLERRLGADLGDVRLHSDDSAARAAQRQGARAFALGSDIFLGAGERSDDLALVGHEAAHVLQQRGGGAGAQQPQRLAIGNGDSGGNSGAALEAEARSAGAAVAAGQTFHVSGKTGGAVVQRSNDAPGDKPSLWQRGLQGLSDAVEFGESIGWGLLDRYAPELSPILKRGPEGLLDWLKERISDGVQSLIDGVMAPVRAAAGVGQQLASHFAPLVAWVQEAAAKIARNDCSPLREAAERIELLAAKLIQPIVEKLQPVIKKIEDFFTAVWNKVGAPIWGWIKSVAGKAWDKLQQLGTWIWDKCAPIRKAVAKAWTWLKNKIGIGDGPEGQNGILQWIERKVGDAWALVKAKLEPWRKEITAVAAVVGGVLLMLSPAGPVIAVGVLVYAIVQGVRWVKAHWGRGNMIVQARVFLQRTLIPALLSGAHKFGNALVSAANKLAATLGKLADGMGRMVGAVAGSALQFLVTAVQWVATQIDAIALWAAAKLVALADKLEAALQRLSAFLQKIGAFLGRVADVVIDIYGLPLLLGEKLWNLVPACIRDPFIDFIGPLILRQIEFFQELGKDAVAWAKTKADIANLIRLVFKNHDLIGAVKAAFRLLLRVFNVPVELAATVLAKAMAAWDVVSAKPLAFIKNTVRAIGNGFKRLWKGLAGHLAFGVEGWLFGELTDKGIAPPTSWTDPKAVFGFVLDVLGVSMDHVFELMAKRFDPTRVAQLRTWYGRIGSAIAWVREAIDTSKTPAENTKGLIDKAKDFGASVLSGVAEWVAGKVAEELAIMATAAAATGGLSEVLDVLRRIYKAIKTAVRWARKILEMANKVLDTVLDIASGAIEAAGERFEAAMHAGMPVVIGFLADQVGLGGIGKALREIIDDLRQKVDDAILWVIDKIKGGLQALMGAAKGVVAVLVDWWHQRFEFSTDAGDKHTILLEGEPPNTKVVVRSDATELGLLIGQMPEGQPKDDALAQQQTIKTLMGELNDLNKIATADQTPKNVLDAKTKKAAVYTAMQAVAAALKKAQVLDDAPLDQVKKIGPKPAALRPSISVPGESLGSTAMRVEGLTRLNKDEGSSTRTPAPNPGVWDAINDVHSRRYVQGHLLNRLLGGSGTDLSNLTPITSSANGNHKNRAEGDVKAMFESGKVLMYEVVVNYPSVSKPKTVINELCSSLSVKWQQQRLPKTAGAKLMPFGPVFSVQIGNPPPS